MKSIPTLYYYVSYATGQKNYYDLKLCVWTYDYVPTSDDFIILELTNTEKLVKCEVLHNTGGLLSLSCTIPSLDHPPVVWLLQHTQVYMYM